MYTIGLTGGIASGKSTVAGMLRKLGAPVIDADALSRALTAPGGDALPAVRVRFGDAVFDGDTLDRRALANHVFGNEAARASLNAILHPMVFSAIEAQLSQLQREGASIAVLEVPLLFESGYDARVDEIWLTVLPRATQLQRLMARDGWSEAEAEARIDSQWPVSDKLPRAHVHIDTAATIASVSTQVRSAWQRALRKVDQNHATFSARSELT